MDKKIDLGPHPPSVVIVVQLIWQVPRAVGEKEGLQHNKPVAQSLSSLQVPPSPTAQPESATQNKIVKSIERRKGDSFIFGAHHSDHAGDPPAAAFQGRTLTDLERSLARKIMVPLQPDALYSGLITVFDLLRAKHDLSTYGSVGARLVALPAEKRAADQSLARRPSNSMIRSGASTPFRPRVG